MRKFLSRFHLPSSSPLVSPQPPPQTQPLTPATKTPEISAQNSPLLYLIYYARPKHPGSYHLALHVCSSATSPRAVKYHCKNILQRVDVTGVDDGVAGGDVTVNGGGISGIAHGEAKRAVQEIWTFEEKDVDARHDYWLRARIFLGHLTFPFAPQPVTTPPDFEVLMRSIPVTVQPADDPEFDCVEWVRRALEAVRGKDMLEGDEGLEWEELDGRGRRWVARMVESGRAGGWRGW